MQFKTENVKFFSMNFKRGKGYLAIVDLVIKSLHQKGKGFSKLFK